MPMCPSGCVNNFTFVRGPFDFDFSALDATLDVTAYDARPRDICDRAAVERVTAKLQTLYDSLAGNEKVMLESLIRRAAAVI